MKSLQHVSRRASSSKNLPLGKLGGFAAVLLSPTLALAVEGDSITINFSSQEKLWLYFALIIAFIALAYAGLLAKQVQQMKVGDKMRTIGTYIEEGAKAYLVQQGKMMIPFIVLLAGGLTYLYSGQSLSLGLGVAGCFIAGVISSYVSGSLGMLIAVKSNMRVAGAALRGNKLALETAFRAGAFSGLVTVGIGLIGATVILLFGSEKATALLIGYGFGASLAALFMRVGGGIYTKAADVGADLVGKVEAGIPEDDARNPAVIADNVGDNVGDCAGMAADVFESFEVTLVAAIILGAAAGAVLDAATWPKLIIFAMATAAVGILASMIGMSVVRGSSDVDTDPLKPILGGFRVGAALASIFTFVVSYLLMQNITAYDLIPLKTYEARENQAIRRIQSRVAKSKGVDNFKVKVSDILEDPAFAALGIKTASERDKQAANQQIVQATVQDSGTESEVKPLVGFQRVTSEMISNPEFKAGNYSTQAAPPTDPSALQSSRFISLKDKYFSPTSAKLAVLQIRIVRDMPEQKDPSGKVVAPASKSDDTTWVGPVDETELRKQIRTAVDTARSQNMKLDVEIKERRPVELFYSKKEDQFALAVVGEIDRPSAIKSAQVDSYFRATTEQMETALKDSQNQQDAANSLSPVQMRMEVAFARTNVVPWWSFGLAVTFGILMALVIEAITNYYVGAKNRPTQEVAGVSTAGPAPMIIQGFAYGAESSVFMVLAIVVALLLPLYLFPVALFGSQVLGFYGVALVGLGLLTTTAYILAMDTFGPISDNAQGVFEMSGEGKDDENAAKILQRLDAAGNTTKALTKGFAIATAVVASVALFHSFVEQAHLETLGLRLDVPEIFLGLLIGAATPFLFSAFAINAVGRSAFDLIREVRRQFHAEPGILAGTVTPDYARCVAIVTAAAQKELVGPGILAICLPIAVGFGFSIGKPTVEIAGIAFNLAGAQALGGFLAGAIASGQLMAVLLSNSGAMWDNAKKLVEDGMFGGKGTDAHKAAVVCDTVGDPFKDTAGPALNPLIKVMNLVGLLLAGVVIQPLATNVQVLITVVAVALLAYAVYRAKKGSLSESLQHIGEDLDPSDPLAHAPVEQPKKKRITVDDEN